MSKASPLPPFSAIVVAAGKGLRAGQPIPKQFANWRGKPVVRHSVEKLFRHGAEVVVVAIPEGAESIATECLSGLDGFRLVIGGATRQQSVLRALEALAAISHGIVLIHDAARPDLPSEVTRRLVENVTANQGAIPVLPVTDSLAIAQDDMMTGSAKREDLRRVQTPQAFDLAAILAAHRNWTGEPDAGDDAQVFRASGGEIALVSGDERLAKLTYAEDFMTDHPLVRTGTGFDVHRLAAGEELWLGGVQIDHDKGLAGHSDADVAIHALVDAMLGAIALGDIGSHFPPSDPQWKGASSATFLRHAARLVDDQGYMLANVDLTIMCEAPKIGPHRDSMRARIAELLEIDVALVSIKATTTERLGFTGREEGIAAQAVATLQRI
ncbi:MAG: bifunctional 2-C-methyl-D-erythritol 4-phosphate cytidylyltransferase/2-C-methyl-D-erythritol 2,4-cyclodiphosphate synthase [Citromicrobium sp.]|nr:MAG: bifunctional 2-C-methyl-D-erythritol 4-phosphate cytidylyltransferase/2-C-methyl-D-erythritol 2,4-cyclodiphosphate synthase [Citromicrobium sp.]